MSSVAKRTIMPTISINSIEEQLHKRLAYPYVWDRRQNDAFDQRTNFIYNVVAFDKLLAQANARFADSPQHDALFNYALNRWYNFWSARAVEAIFCSLNRVEQAKSKDRLVDFSIDGILFDHKTSVFPKRYPHSFVQAQQRPCDLLQWLYANQSQQQRKHLKNRLFIVLHAQDGEHWKLKAQIAWLRRHIQQYVAAFDVQRMHTLAFADGSTALADVIWAVQA